MRGDAGVDQEGRRTRRGSARRGGAGWGSVLRSGGSVRLPAVSNDHLRCREAVTHIDRNRFQMA